MLVDRHATVRSVSTGHHRFAQALLPLALCLAPGCAGASGTDDGGGDEIAEPTATADGALSYDGWTASSEACYTLPGTGLLGHFESHLCIQAFARAQGGKVFARSAVWVTGAFVNFEWGNELVNIQKGDGAYVSFNHCVRASAFGMNSKTQNGEPVALWLCRDEQTVKAGNYRARGEVCFNVDHDGRGDRCVWSPPTPYVKND